MTTTYPVEFFIEFEVGAVQPAQRSSVQAGCALQSSYTPDEVSWGIAELIILGRLIDTEDGLLLAEGIDPLN